MSIVPAQVSRQWCSFTRLSSAMHIVQSLQSARKADNKKPPYRVAREYLVSAVGNWGGRGETGWVPNWLFKLLRLKSPSVHLILSTCWAETAPAPPQGSHQRISFSKSSFKTDSSAREDGSRLRGPLPAAFELRRTRCSQGCPNHRRP